jgi:hypothetical protein
MRFMTLSCENATRADERRRDLRPHSLAGGLRTPRRAFPRKDRCGGMVESYPPLGSAGKAEPRLRRRIARWGNGEVSYVDHFSGPAGASISIPCARALPRLLPRRRKTSSTAPSSGPLPPFPDVSVNESARCRSWCRTARRPDNSRAPDARRTKPSTASSRGRPCWSGRSGKRTRSATGSFSSGTGLTSAARPARWLRRSPPTHIFGQEHHAARRARADAGA